VNVQNVMDEIQRDRWGRPLIEPPDGGKPVAYTRVSTLAKSLDKQEALTKWKQRMTAIGVSQRPDLLALVQATREDDRKTLDDACEQALAAARSGAAANTGTALHSFTERIDEGVPLEEIVASDLIKADLAAYRERVAGLRMLAAEVFVVQDDIKCAGTFDRLIQIDGRAYVADIKTGQHEPNYPGWEMAQTATRVRAWHSTKPIEKL
jgi:hypothetical protein